METKSICTPVLHIEYLEEGPGDGPWCSCCMVFRRRDILETCNVGAGGSRAARDCALCPRVRWDEVLA